MEACQSNNAMILQNMLNQFNENAFNQTAINKLIKNACMNDYIDILIVFYNQKTKYNIKFDYIDPTNKCNYLHYCCRFDSLNCLLFLLKNDCCNFMDINAFV